MANAKLSGYITEIRQWCNQYRQLMRDGRALLARGDALYKILVVEAEITEGGHGDIIPTGTSRKDSVLAVLVVIKALCDGFYAGVDATIERATT